MGVGGVAQVVEHLPSTAKFKTSVPQKNKRTVKHSAGNVNKQNIKHKDTM
jgi:hypothetical protein